MNLNFVKLCASMGVIKIIANYLQMNSEEEEEAIIIFIPLKEILSNGKDFHF